MAARAQKSKGYAKPGYREEDMPPKGYPDSKDGRENHKSQKGQSHKNSGHTKGGYSLQQKGSPSKGGSEDEQRNSFYDDRSKQHMSAYNDHSRRGDSAQPPADRNNARYGETASSWETPPHERPAPSWWPSGKGSSSFLSRGPRAGSPRRNGSPRRDSGGQKRAASPNRQLPSRSTSLKRPQASAGADLPQSTSTYVRTRLSVLQSDVRKIDSPSDAEAKTERVVKRVDDAMQAIDAFRRKANQENRAVKILCDEWSAQPTLTGDMAQMSSVTTWCRNTYLRLPTLGEQAEQVRIQARMAVDEKEQLIRALTDWFIQQSASSKTQTHVCPLVSNLIKRLAGSVLREKPQDKEHSRERCRDERRSRGRSRSRERSRRRSWDRNRPRGRTPDNERSQRTPNPGGGVGKGENSKATPGGSSRGGKNRSSDVRPPVLQERGDDASGLESRASRESKVTQPPGTAVSDQYRKIRKEPSDDVLSSSSESGDGIYKSNRRGPAKPQCDPLPDQPDDSGTPIPDPTPPSPEHGDDSSERGKKRRDGKGSS